MLEEQAERAEDWLTEIMEDVGGLVVNGDAPSEHVVPIKAETAVCKSWGDKK